MLSTLVFIISNIAIFLGYVTIARYIIPSLNVMYRSTKFGGLAFFALCGLTHLDLGIHAIMGETISPSDYTSWHMMLIHIPQAIAVWVFTYGLYKEIGRKDGSFLLKSYRGIISKLLYDMSALRKHMSREDLVLLNEAIANVTELQNKISSKE